MVNQITTIMVIVIAISIIWYAINQPLGFQLVKKNPMNRSRHRRPVLQDRCSTPRGVHAPRNGAAVEAPWETVRRIGARTYVRATVRRVSWLTWDETWDFADKNSGISRSNHWFTSKNHGNSV